MLEDALKNLGELFLFGLHSPQLNDETAAFISQAKIGGIIYFAGAYQDPRQLAQLSQDLQGCSNQLPLWLSVDQEGGRVQRFKGNGFTRIPSAYKVAESDSPKRVFEISEIIAKELAACGINLNFYPCADILTQPSNQVIGDRSFGKTEAQVTKMVSAAIRGHLVHQVQVCLKHFPGHGNTIEDSHFHLPSVESSLEELRNREFRPFVKGFKSRCGMVMTSHVINKSIDPDKPATLSKIVLQDILRSELRFTKVIVSDDMEMKAITDHFGVDQAPLLAIEAGCDLIIYRTEEAARHAYEVVRKALESGELPPQRVLESIERIQNLKKETLSEYRPPDVNQVQSKVGTKEHEAVVKPLLNES